MFRDFLGVYLLQTERTIWLSYRDLGESNVWFKNIPLYFSEGQIKEIRKWKQNRASLSLNNYEIV
jgi:hypothetical protein